MPLHALPRVAVRALLLTMLALAAAAPARARDLQDLIEKLYGGDNKITLLDVGGPPHPAVFDATKGLKTINGIKRALRGIAKNLPIDLGSSSFTYELNPETGAPERVATEGLGPLLFQRANTVGQSHFLTAFAYTHVDFHTLNDVKITHGLSFIAPLVQPAGSQFPFDQDVVAVNVYIRSVEDIFDFFFTYGVTDWLDLGIMFNLTRQDLDIETRATLIDNGRGVHRFDPTPGRVVAPNVTPTDAPNDGGHQVVFGMGDTLARFKLQPLEAIWRTFLNEAPPTRKYFNFALLGTMAIPTGDQNNLLGSGGAPDYRMLGIFSKTFGDGDWFEPAVNIGYKWSVDGGRDAFLYSFGAAVKVNEWLTFSAGAGGRVEEDFNNSPGTDIVDFLGGIKINPISKLVIGFNVIKPLNTLGLREDWLQTISLEWLW